MEIPELAISVHTDKFAHWSTTSPGVKAEEAPEGICVAQQIQVARLSLRNDSLHLSFPVQL